MTASQGGTAPDRRFCAADICVGCAGTAAQLIHSVFVRGAPVLAGHGRLVRRDRRARCRRRPGDPEGVVAHLCRWLPGGPFWDRVFSLAAVVLAVAGAEALYADMGQIGRAPITRVWLILVLPPPSSVTWDRAHWPWVRQWPWAGRPLAAGHRCSPQQPREMQPPWPGTRLSSTSSDKILPRGRPWSSTTSKDDRRDSISLVVTVSRAASGRRVTGGFSGSIRSARGRPRR